jgi:PAS domain S-box-containing protein
VLNQPFWATPWWRGSAEMPAQLRAAIARAADGEVFRAVLRYWVADGTERLVDFALHPIRDAAGTVMCLHPTGIDITERTQAEEAVRTLTATLEQRVQERTAALDASNGQLQQAIQAHQYTEATLRMREAQYRLALEAAELGTWIHELDTDMVHQDTRASRQFGFAALVTPLAQVLARIHPEDRPWMAQHIATMRTRTAQESRFTVEYRIVLPDETLRWIRVQAYLTFAGEGAARRPTRVVGTSQDITARKQADEALCQSDDRLRLATQTAALGIWEWHLPTNQLRWDAQMFRIYQVAPTPDGMVPYSTWSHAVVPEELPQQEARLRETIRRGGTHTRTFCIRRAGDGTTRHIEAVETVRTNAQGQAEWVVGTNIDVTERVQAEAALHQLAATLEQRVEERTAALRQEIAERQRLEAERRRLDAQLQASQKLESLGVLAGGIAHDFNNLLVGILGHAELCQLDLPDDSPLQTALRHIVTAAERAAALCHQMLAYAGHGLFVNAPVQLNLLTTDTLTLVRHGLGPQTRLHLELAPTVPLVQGDPSQLQQVIMNLLLNAAEALRDAPGDIRLRTATRQIAPAALATAAIVAPDLPDGPYVCLEVEDTGCGMDPDTLSKIFDPFFTTKFTGRGLGLAAVLGIVRAHHGALQVESTLGHGSTFRLLLPPAPPALASSQAAELPAPAWHGTGMVLVVDDEPLVRELTRNMVAALGLTPVTAARGPDALRLWQRHGAALHAVLLDLTMPDMDGLQTLHALREQAPTLPVLLLSGYTEQAVAETLRTQRAVAFLHKPFTLAELQAALHTLLEPGAADP